MNEDDIIYPIVMMQEMIDVGIKYDLQRKIRT